MVNNMSQNLNRREKMLIWSISGGAIGITGFLLARGYGLSICKQFLEQKWFTLILVSGIASLSGFLRWKYQRKLLGLFAWYINIAAGLVFVVKILRQSQIPLPFGILIVTLQIGIHYSTIAIADHFSTNTSVLSRIK
ncbi:MAG: hypothetical protein WHX52_22755 [Anaerolineae bacterium]